MSVGRDGGLSGELFGDLLKCFGKYGVFLGMVNGSFIRLLRVPLSVRNGLKVGVKRLNYIILRRTLDGNQKIVLSGI